jgi:hypothetical protein
MLSSASPNPPYRSSTAAPMVGVVGWETVTCCDHEHQDSPKPSASSTAGGRRMQRTAWGTNAGGDLAAEAEPLKCAVLMRVVAGLYVVRGTSHSVHYTRKLCQ